MSYFNKFPIISNYKFGNMTMPIIDLTKRLAVSRLTRTNEANYIQYEIIDGDTPIILADRLYNDITLSWVILFFNNMIDESNDWPMTEAQLTKWVLVNYNDLGGIYQYESLATNNVVDINHPEYDKVIVTNYEYFTRLNDQKRQIFIPTEQTARLIAKEHKRLISR